MVKSFSRADMKRLFQILLDKVAFFCVWFECLRNVKWNENWRNSSPRRNGLEMRLIVLSIPVPNDALPLSCRHSIHCTQIMGAGLTCTKLIQHCPWSVMVDPCLQLAQEVEEFYPIIPVIMWWLWASTSVWGNSFMFLWLCNPHTFFVNQSSPQHCFHCGRINIMLSPMHTQQPVLFNSTGTV